MTVICAFLNRATSTVSVALYALTLHVQQQKLRYMAIIDVHAGGGHELIDMPASD